MRFFYPTFLLLLSLSFPINAQWSSEQLIIAGTGTGREAKPYDMDGDGDMDIIEVNGHAVGWHEQVIPTGSFVYHLIGAPSRLVLNASLDAADFDGDGDLDIVVGTDQLYWYRNDGLSFSEGFPIANSDSSFGHDDIEAQDMDGDGNMDIITNQVHLFHNDGNGNFTFQEVGIGGFYMTIVDWDADDDLDIFAVGDSKITYHENMGNTNFNSSTIIDFGINAGWSVDIKDFDQDDDLDIIAAMYDIGEVWWYKNDGNNGFEEIVKFAGTPDIRHCRVFDVDSDGDNDFFTLRSSAPHASWIEQLGDHSETFAEEVGLFEMPSPGLAYIADLDNDLDDDLVITQANEDRYWLENTGSGLEIRSFVPENNVPLSNIFGANMIDYNQDEELDVIVFGFSDVVGVDHFGNGSFAQANHPILDVAVQSPYMMRSVDLSEDGIPDLVKCGTSLSGISWYLNDESDTLKLQQHISDLGGRDIVFGDLDQDGDMDIVSAQQFDNQVHWHENLGQGNSWETHLVGNFDKAYRLGVALINEDGFPDIVVGSFDGAIRWYENQMDGSFSPKPFIDDGVNTWGNGQLNFKVADINGDGFMDVVSNANVWYDNGIGMGLFGPPQTIDPLFPEGWSFDKIELADIDQDYDLDYIAYYDQMLVFHNDGTAHFSEPDTVKMLSDITRLHEIRAVDLDQDQDQDVVLTFRESGRVSWVENLSAVAPSMNLVIETIACNDNQTPDDSSDDFLDIWFQVQATALSAAFTLNLDGQALPNPFAYGVSHHLEWSSFSDIEIELFATDLEDASMTSTTSVNLPAACLVLGSENLSISNINFQLAPNPAIDESSLTFQLDQSQILSIHLSNSLGQVVKVIQHNKQFPTGQANQTIPLDFLQPGLYFLEIDNGHQKMGIKLLKIDQY